eukprot:6972104-Prymnesium_polylepis.1
MPGTQGAHPGGGGGWEAGLGENGGTVCKTVGYTDATSQTRYEVTAGGAGQRWIPRAAIHGWSAI